LGNGIASLNKYIKIVVMQQLYIIRPSKIFVVTILLMHFCALIGVVSAKLAWSAELSLIAVILFSLYYSIRRYYFFRGADLVREFGNVGENWILKCKQDEQIKADLFGTCFVAKNLILLFFKAERKKYSAVICCDSLSGDALRRLRVELVCR
jgi:hypothetical protein